VKRLALVAVAGIIVWVALVALLVLCGEGIKHSAGIESFDRRITNFVVAHRTPALNTTMKIVTWMGSWIAVLVVAACVGLLAWRRRLPLFLVGVVVATWVGELLAVTITKTIVERDRPPEPVRLVVTHGWSFPSGHTANAVVVFATATGLAAAFIGSRCVRVAVWTAAVLAVALVGFSRIELGVHWMTDVLASVVWTVVWILAVWAFLRTRSHDEAAAVKDGSSTIVRPDG
jgi:membrane-associated phospholipid phosphatase